MVQAAQIRPGVAPWVALSHPSSDLKALASGGRCTTLVSMIVCLVVGLVNGGLWPEPRGAGMIKILLLKSSESSGMMC